MQREILPQCLYRRIYIVVVALNIMEYIIYMIFLIQNRQVYDYSLKEKNDEYPNLMNVKISHWNDFITIDRKDIGYC